MGCKFISFSKNKKVTYCDVQVMSEHDQKKPYLFSLRIISGDERHKCFVPSLNTLTFATKSEEQAVWYFADDVKAHMLSLRISFFKFWLDSPILRSISRNLLTTSVPLYKKHSMFHMIGSLTINGCNSPKQVPWKVFLILVLPIACLPSCFMQWFQNKSFVKLKFETRFKLYQFSGPFLYPSKTLENQRVKIPGGIERKHWPEIGWGYT